MSMQYKTCASSAEIHYQFGKSAFTESVWKVRILLSPQFTDLHCKML